MWFLVISAGIVIAVVAGLLAGPARRAGHPALGGFAESAPLPAVGASVFIALGLAHHDSPWTLAWLVLAYTAWIMITSRTGNLAGRARRAGHPALGGFIDSASFPVSVAFLWVVLGLALNHVDWISLAAIPLGYAVWAVPRILRRRRGNA
jgi:hypothetical protein